MTRSTHTASGRPRVSRQIELMLAADVEHLGHTGDIVRVKPGYARNYLMPNGLATVATEANKLMVKKYQEKLVEIQKQKMQELQSRVEAIGKYSVTLEANANEEGHLYGSIMGADISKSLKTAGFPVDADHVKLDGPIKELGMYTVKVQLHPEAKTEIKVWVVPSAKK